MTLTEHWTGTSWSVVPSPNPFSTFSHLAGVAAVASNDIWAVGYGARGGDFKTLAIHWDGSAWGVGANPHRRRSGFLSQRRDCGLVE
jgi:hypothetical protein